MSPFGPIGPIGPISLISPIKPQSPKPALGCHQSPPCLGSGTGAVGGS